MADGWTRNAVRIADKRADNEAGVTNNRLDVNALVKDADGNIIYISSTGQQNTIISDEGGEKVTVTDNRLDANTRLEDEDGNTQKITRFNDALVKDRNAGNYLMRILEKLIMIEEHLAEMNDVEGNAHVDHIDNSEDLL